MKSCHSINNRGEKIMESKLKHLEIIQGVINRMAGNSFLLKGWAITLVAALFALFAKDNNHAYILIAYLPVIIFWILDGYFLSQERLLCNLYDDVRKFDEKEINFSMDTTNYKKDKQNSWVYSIFSTTLSWFYLPLIVLILFIKWLIK